MATKPAGTVHALRHAGRPVPTRLPEGGHAFLGFRIGLGTAVECKLVVYDDAVDLVVAGLPAGILLGEHELLRLERLIRQARRMLPGPADPAV